MITSQVIKEGSNEIETKTCARWQGEGNASDMAVIEVGVISGFVPDGEVITKVLITNPKQSPKVRNVYGTYIMLIHSLLIYFFASLSANEWSRAPSQESWFPGKETHHVLWQGK